MQLLYTITDITKVANFCKAYETFLTDRQTDHHYT